MAALPVAFVPRPVVFVLLPLAPPVFFVPPTLPGLATAPAVAIGGTGVVAGAVPGQREIDLASHDAD
jgi:hypothetical protein